MTSNTRVLETSAILFDMDGVLVDSRLIVERAWRRWGVKHGLDVNAILAVAHGRRTRDTVADVAPHLDAAKEGAWLDASERRDNDGMVAVPGAVALLSALPRDRWAIVTSADQELAIERLTVCGLPLPEHLISTDMVDRGKPHPDGYLLGAARLGVTPASCIVFEDSPPGIAAGVAAGMRVVGVATTQARSKLRSVEAIIDDQRQVAVRVVAGGLEVTLTTEPQARR